VSAPSVNWVDGERQQNVPLPDRGLDYGDGLFETLLLESNKPLFPDLHWQRLRRGLTVLEFPDCIERVMRHFQLAIDELQQENWPRTALRITVTRGAGPRGYTPPQVPKPRVIVSATRLGSANDSLPTAASLVKASMRWGNQPALMGIKHLNRLEQVLAAVEKQRAGADEALMLGQSWQLVSVASGNLFIVLDGEIHTPLLDECGIAGTRRQLVIETWAPAAGYRVSESRLDLAALQDASEVFYSNTLWGLRPVASLEDLRWDRHTVCNDLYKQYRGAFL
jgi:4-amino-4-deoxychorismate lyase